MVFRRLSYRLLRVSFSWQAGIVPYNNLERYWRVLSAHIFLVV